MVVGRLGEDELMRPLVDDVGGAAAAALAVFDAVLGEVEGVLVVEVFAFGFADEQDFVEEEDVALPGDPVVVGFDRHLSVALEFPVVGQRSVLLCVVVVVRCC